MKPTLAVMSGSLKGCTLTPEGVRFVLGEDPDCAVRFPPSQARPVASRHAEIWRDGGDWRVRTLLDEPVIVNDTPVRETVLYQNDLLRLGPRGPLMRFHLADGDGRTKSFRQILMDSVAFTKENARRGSRISRAGSFVGSLVREAVDHGTRRLKVAGFVLGFLLLASLGLSIHLLIAGQNRSRILDDRLRAQERTIEARDRELAEAEARRAREREAAEARARAEAERLLEALQLERDQLEALREALAALESARDADAVRIERLLEGSEAVSSELDELRGVVGAAERIFRESGPGVCLIGLGVGFWHEGSQGFVRRAADPADRSEGGLMRRMGLTVGGEGERVVEWITGSGFVIDAEGLVLSNRHVVDPWWASERFGNGLLQLGFKPVRVAFFACLPDHEEVVPLRRVGAAAEADIAFARLDHLPEGVPVLALAPEEVRPVEGQKTVLLGFPEGVQGLVNKLDDATTARLRGLGLSDLGDVLQALAANDAVHPAMTQGVLSNVNETNLVYDAVTASGGSGGPLFGSDGRVIGVNTAVSRNYTGANYATPIRKAHEVLARGPLLETVPDVNEVALEEALTEPVERTRDEPESAEETSPPDGGEREDPSEEAAPTADPAAEEPPASSSGGAATDPGGG